MPRELHKADWGCQVGTPTLLLPKGKKKHLCKGTPNSALLYQTPHLSRFSIVFLVLGSLKRSSMTLWRYNRLLGKVPSLITNKDRQQTENLSEKICPPGESYLSMGIWKGKDGKKGLAHYCKGSETAP